MLVIDDDELSREVLRLLLEEEGYAVEAAPSGEVALEMLGGGGRGSGEGGEFKDGSAGAGGPDVVLMDLQMPGLCGEDLAREVRGRCGGSTRLLAMSGSPLRDEDAGAYDAFLLKPFSMEEFARVLREGGSTRAEATTGLSISPGASEVLDEKIFAGFAAMIGAEPMRELYGHCLRDAATQLRAMRRAARESDDAGLRKCAHAMKGSLGMVGARELERMCSAFERNGLQATTFASFAEFADGLGRLRGMLVAHGVDVTEVTEV